MARPGGNITGFTPLEFGANQKWLELLKELKPTINREASPGERAFFPALQSAAPALSIEITPIDPHGPAEIERGLAAFAVGSTEGLVVPAIPSINAYRDLIISLAAKYRVPAVYAFRQNVVAGGLVSYGPDQFDHYRRAAAYIDRREARQSSCAGTHQVRACDQSQDRQGARPHSVAIRAYTCR